MMMIAFKRTPELNSYTAPHLEWLVQSRKAFQSSRERLTKQGVAMRRSDHILIGLRSQRKEKDVGEIQHKVGENKCG